MLPGLPDDHRIALTADEFLDHFAAAYVRRALRGILEDLRDAPAASAAFNNARHAFDAQTSIDALRWLRRCSFPRSPGTSAMGQQAFSHALIALGHLATPGDVLLLPHGEARAADARYEILSAVGTVTATQFRLEAERRLVRYRSAGRRPADFPTFLVAGSVGSFDDAQGLPTDVSSESATNDIVAGPLVVNPKFVRAEDHVP